MGHWELETNVKISANLVQISCPVGFLLAFDWLNGILCKWQNMVLTQRQFKPQIILIQPHFTASFLLIYDPSCLLPMLWSVSWSPSLQSCNIGWGKGGYFCRVKKSLLWLRKRNAESMCKLLFTYFWLRAVSLLVHVHRALTAVKLKDPTPIPFSATSNFARVWKENLQDFCRRMI